MLACRRADWPPQLNNANIRDIWTVDCGTLSDCPLSRPTRRSQDSLGNEGKEGEYRFSVLNRLKLRYRLTVSPTRRTAGVIKIAKPAIEHEALMPWRARWSPCHPPCEHGSRRIVGIREDKWGREINESAFARNHVRVKNRIIWHDERRLLNQSTDVGAYVERGSFPEIDKRRHLHDISRWTLWPCLHHYTVHLQSVSVCQTGKCSG